jgi:hypothetical protein
MEALMPLMEEGIFRPIPSLAIPGLRCGAPALRRIGLHDAAALEWQRLETRV